MKSLRWWMIGAVDARLDHQLPDAQHARRGGADAAPGSAHHHAAVLLDRRRLPGRDHAAAALRLRARRARAEGRASPSSPIAWSLISMAHGLAHNWQAFAGLRGLLGLAEGSANPAGMKATAEWFPAQRARPGRRGLQHRRLGRLDARAAAGRLGDPRLQLAGGVRDHRRRSGWCGWCCGCSSTSRPTGTRALSASERDYIVGGPGAAPRRRRHAGPSIARILRAAELLGHRAAALPGRSDMGHADLLAAALPEHGAALRSEADRAVRLAAVPGRGSRLHVRRRRSACALQKRAASA